ncbi:aromatic amino acid DMT transporter YddG [Pseudomonas sp. PSKL.D1]|uniref:aromatic amino acid DMT transporter YddG n=1 Tax=Pseudomonas sp. PSKL.D1 TaxID=3029060 RepID=UPI002380EEB0|nr:aromatic amino acid DMT transporter YddG [Pseudomonas sp. PSKL.D1]WDY60494.1 aromatic amino acid DMT transporter YddG [Pseudomonas sp. PSKL.D1]
MITSKRGATMSGLLAIAMWSMSIALIRSISSTFGPAGGAALIYTLGTILLLVLLGKPRLRSTPWLYLVVGGALFVTYDVSMSLALGYATTDTQAVEVSIVNYLWPCLTVVISIWMNGQRARWMIVPGTMLAIFGILWGVAGDGLSLERLAASVESNPVAFGLAFVCALSFSLYCNITRRYAGAGNQVVLFFMLTTAALWTKYALSDEQLHGFSLASSVELAVAALAVGGGYALWNHGITRGNLTLLATASYFAPVLSAAFAAIWLGANLTVQFWQGAVLVTAGSLLCWYATRELAPSAEAQA